jgi:hypothetical protein
MRRWVMATGGFLLLLVGAVWTLQGLDMLGGSPMTGVGIWAVVGPLVGAVGIAFMVSGFRGNSRPPR